MSLPFSTLPSTVKAAPLPFQVSIPQERLSDLESLLKLSKIAPNTYENSRTNSQYGVTKDWLMAMRERWLDSYKW